jgi:hypothetical protein
MTHKIPTEPQKPSAGTEQGSAALTDQWIEKNWYLPPGGDHSWREREAERLFHGEDSAHDKGDSLPVGEDAPTANEIDGAYDPGFKRPWALNVLIPISLATCAAIVVVVILGPKILAPGLWGPSEPKALPDTPLRIIDTAGADENATARLTAGSDLRQGKQEVVHQALPQPIGQAVVPPEADQKTVLPQLRPQLPVIAKQDRQSDKSVARVAKAQPLQVQSSKKPAGKSLPPIGAAYFASHAPAGAAGKSAATVSRPIGQAYFENRSRTTAD